jgi:hypothetical protein
MKTVIKPKKGWRSPIGDLIRAAWEPVETLQPSTEVAFSDAVAGWTALQRSWFLRAPQSAWLAEKENPGVKRAAPQTVKAAARKTRLPSVAIRRTTLIEIVRNKRGQADVFE